MQTSIGARSWFSRAERDFLTESESPWVADAASSGSREEELVERNAAAALKTAGTSRRGEAEVWSLQTSIGARSCFSGAEHLLPGAGMREEPEFSKCVPGGIEVPD